MDRTAAKHGALLALVWAAGYGASLGDYFLCDTFDLIANARRLGEAGIGAFFSSPIGGFYRPLVQLSLLADLRVWGLRPAGFHLTNVVVGLVGVWLVYALARTLLPRRPRVALAAGLLFALHPLHPQAIAWVAGRNDALCALFYLLALLLVVRAASARGGPALALGLGAVLAFALALLSKEMAISFPLAAFAALVLAPQPMPWGRRLGWAVGAAAALAGVAVGYALKREAVVGSLIGGYGAGAHLRFEPAALFYGLERPLYALAKPMDVAALTGGIAPQALDRFLEAPLVLAAAAALWLGWTRRVGLALAWLLITLLPIVTLRVGLSDARLLYLPSAMACLVVAFAAARLAERGRWRSVVVGALAVVSVVYGGALAREVVLWRQASGVARRVVRQVGELPVDLGRGWLYFAAFPHAYGPVPVFSTGLASALELEYGKPTTGTIPLARLMLTPGAPVRLATAILDRRTIEVSVQPPTAFMVWGSAQAPLTEDLGTATITVSEDRRRAVIRLRDPLDPARGDRVIAYTDAGLRLMPMPLR